MVLRRSIRQRPTQSMAQAIITSNLRREIVRSKSPGFATPSNSPQAELKPPSVKLRHTELTARAQETCCRALGLRQALNFERSYCSALLPDIDRFLASLRSSIVSSMIVVGTKLCGNERGGNSLKVATTWKTSSIAP